MRRTLLLLSLLLAAMRPAFAQDCCGRPACMQEVDSYVVTLKRILNDFIPIPATKEERIMFLDAFAHQEPANYATLRKLVFDLDKVRTKDSTWLLCFATRLLLVNAGPSDENILRWFDFLTRQLLPSDFTSPEFKKGFGLHFDVNQGVADVGKSSQSYSFSMRVLAAYTFTKKGKATGGKWRILARPSWYYQDNRGYLLVNPRVEYRFKDLGNKLVSIGNIKLIADANFGDINIYGVGAALELYFFGAQVLYQRQDKIKSNHLLLGLFYRFQKRK
jgi:hypothetical protein